MNLAIFVSVAYASTESITIKPGTIFVKNLQLDDADRVTLTFRVLGTEPSTLRFSVFFPNGTTIDFGTSNSYSDSFSTDVKGECQLRFVNVDSAESQLLTLDYSIEKYVLGMPSLIFILLAISVLLVFVFAGYMIMSKYPS